MKVTELFDTAREALTVTRVYAEPYERDGLTVSRPRLSQAVPAAARVPTRKGSRVRAAGSASTHDPSVHTSSRTAT